MAGPALFFLGSPRIERGGVPVDVDTRKAIALAAYLALSRQRQSRDVLAALLWPEYEEGRAALRRTLSVLKKALGEGSLDVDRASVGLDWNGHPWVDVDLFQRRLAERLAHRHPETETCPACLKSLKEAVALYRGDFLAGFTLRDCPDFDDWRFFEAEDLRRGLAGALEQLARFLGAQGDLESAIAYARRWLGLDPLHEPAHRSLMELYARAGQRAAALRQYRECVRVLDQELGVAPLEATTQLYQAIKENRALPPPAAAQPKVLARQGDEERISLPRESFPAARADHPLVGRSAEWETLLAAYAAAGAEAHLVVLEGEAGIGKTRLAEELLAHVRASGGVTLIGRCYEGETDLAYSPFVELLRAAVGHAGRDGLPGKIPVPALSEAARLLPELVGLCSGLPPAPPLDNPGAQARFFEGVGQVLLAASGDGPPGVLFVDDAHWADAASLDLLAYLVRRVRGWPLCVLVAWRGECVPAGHRLRRVLSEAQRAGIVTLLPLSRLSRSSVEEWVRSLAAADTDRLGPWSSGQPLPDALGQRLYAETEGVPLVVGEYLTAIAQGTLAADDSRWDLPGGVRDVLRSRLAAVGETGRQVLATAAVIGRSFDLDTLQIAGGRSEEITVAALEELTAQGIVGDVEGSGVGRVPTYDFRHEKLRALVYEETSLARRRLLHRRVAEALVRRGARREIGSLAGQIAHHYRLAGEEVEAAAYFKAAGEHARSLYANAEALDQFRSALALGHPEGGALHEAIGDLQTLLGEYAAALVSYETAAAISAPDALSRIEHKLGDLHHRRGEWELAKSSFRAALTALGEERRTPERARIYADWSLLAHHEGRNDRAIAFARRALDLAERAQNPRALAQVHNVLGILAGHRGELGTARRHLEQSAALAEALGDPGARAAALNNLALACGAEGAMDRALELAAAALAFCVAQGDRHREAALHNNLADLFHAAGQPEAALAHVKQAVTIYAEIGVEAGAVQPQIWKLAEW
ncbi:MAG: AAA family ATPase [Chloroflexota bacterium]|nr:AAA family ATPase [Chloroflexota bacterium]